MSVTVVLPAPSRAEIPCDRARSPSRPRSVAGKSPDRFDALEHGRCAVPMPRPAESQAKRDDRLDVWIVALDPRDDVEHFLVRRAIEISRKLESLTQAVPARAAALGHAVAAGRAAQAEEVVALGRRLYFDRVGPLWLYPHPAPAPAAAEPRRISESGYPDDPNDPARLVVRLEAMTLGCAWLLDRWGELKDLLEDGLVWQPHDRLKAVRMLGRQPLEAVDDRRVMSIYTCCWRMDPTDGHEFTDLMSELGAGERGTYMDRLNAREPMPPESPEAARSALLALVAEEEERLEAILTGHLEREEAEATAALAFDATPEGERLRKYEQALDRELERIIETLRKRHKEAAAKGSPRGRAAAPSGDRASLAMPASSRPHAAGTAAPPDPASPGERAGVAAEPEPAPAHLVRGGSVSRPDPTDGPTEPGPTTAGTAGPVRPKAPGRAQPAADRLADEWIRAACGRLNGTTDLAVDFPVPNRRTAARFHEPAPVRKRHRDDAGGAAMRREPP